MNKSQNLTILGIDTSCDDTCIAFLKIENQKVKILSNVVSSQVKIHRKYGGVYPALAKREHQKNLILVFKKGLKEAKLLKNVKCQISKFKIQTLKEILKKYETLFKKLKKFLQNYQKPKIDLIAVTVGPGLEPCLWVGINFARALSFWWNLPVVPVNHIEAHILVNFIGKSQISNFKSQIFPAICLVVSGGHTQLILMKDLLNLKIIGETRDDAAGECFDKTARVLGMDYPGGPAIEAEASKLQTTNYKLQIKLPRPMIYQKNFDFSFSGLKTAVLYRVRTKNLKLKTKRLKLKTKGFVRAMAMEIQQAIIDVLIHKTIKAVKKYKAKSIILGGGVAANSKLRQQFKLKIKNCKLKVNFLVPPKNFCTDNAVMVAISGYFNFHKRGRFHNKIQAKGNLKII